VRRRRKVRAESWVHFHTFRHSRVTDLFEAGWTDEQVCEFLGHTDPGFTRRVYVHPLPKDPPPLPEDAGVATQVVTEPTETGRDEKVVAMP